MLKNYKYYLENLDCANCAKKIEKAIANQEDFKHVVVNFNTLTLVFESQLAKPYEKIVEIIHKIEPDVKVKEETKEEKKINYELVRFILALFTLLLSFLFKGTMKEIFLILAYGLLLYKTVIKAIKKIIYSKRIDENLLITISAIGAYILGEHMEGLMVVMLYVIGKILEEKAVDKSRRSIKDLLSLKVEYANLKVGDKIKVVKSEELELQDIILIKKGELIPVDGKIIKGSTFLDISSITGESTLESKKEGEKVISGSINKGDIIEVEVTHKYVDSTAYKILELTMNATNNKARVETKVSKIASYYTPIILLLAFLIAFLLPVFTSISVTSSIYRALTFLVISCPCAIAISVPLSYFAGIGISSKNKILVKGSNYLDEVGNCDMILFDKTGTLTMGSFHLQKITSYDKKYSKKDILTLASLGENYSTHPIAKLLMNEYHEKIDVKKVTNFKEIEGKGITYKIGKDSFKVGSASFCNTTYEGNIFISKNEQVIGSFTFDDHLKENAKNVILELKRRNLKTMMITGDKTSFAKDIATKLEMDDYVAEVLPEGKYHKLKELQEHHHVIFVGDGINDTPSLVAANVGISMGSIGSSSAIEASDIVIMNDDLQNLVKILDISKKTRKIIFLNLVFAISIKVIILLLASIGLASMWAAVFADTGVTLINILNSLRILNIKSDK